jgi:uncharacterized protein
MSVDSDQRTVRGPVRGPERALAPDLARGAMLLLIALANAVGVVFAGAPGVDPAPDGVDSGFNLFMFTLVHARAYPVFAIMFGYGLVQLARRQEAAGATPAAVRSVLLRRNTWLIAFGFAHAVLLYFGDFLAAYGVVGIVMTLVLLRRGERTHRFVLWIWALSAVEVLVVGVLAVIAIVAGPTGSAGVPTDHFDSLSAPTYFDGLLDRLAEWPIHTATVLPFILIVWLGTWAARRRVLEEPERHVRLLRWTAATGLGIAAAGGLPLALVSANLLHVNDSTASIVSMLYGASGMFAGPGYVALFGLLALKLSRRTPGPVTGALCALGRRSLSGYLFQSVAWLVLLAPYLMDLGAKFGSPTLAAAAIALLTWLTSVVVAQWMDRRGKNGPAEFALRRLTYGPRKQAVTDR